MLPFPIYRLNEAVTNSLQNIISLDIAQGVQDGLDPMIHFVDEYGGPLSTIAEITERALVLEENEYRRYVTVSATYSQILWMTCSIAMRNHDSIAINCEVEKMTPEEKIKFQQELSIDSPITRYERELLDEEKVFSESADMVNTIELMSIRNLSEEEMQKLYNYDMTSDIGIRINSLYVYAMSFGLLHEFSHHSLNHDFNKLGTLEEEEEADHNAFWTLYSDLEGPDRKTALLGVLCSLVSLIFVNPSLEDDGIHPLPIERIFYFYDIVKDESPNFAGLMCHLFYTWAVYTRDESMPKWNGPYDETIEEIRTYMLEKEKNGNE